MEEHKVKLDGVKAIYTQDGDGNASDLQILRVSSNDCGGGPYFVIKTKRWAFDSIGELVKILEDFKTRISQ